MQRTSFSEAPCPMARALSLVGEWWSLLIIREAFAGVTRFEEFQRRLGISRNALAERLKKLVDGGILARRPVAEGARREEYVLTAMGDDLVTVVVAMMQWGERWLFPVGAATHCLEAATSRGLATLRVTSIDGRPLSRAEVGLAERARLADPASRPPAAGCPE